MLSRRFATTAKIPLPKLVTACRYSASPPIDLTDEIHSRECCEINEAIQSDSTNDNDNDDNNNNNKKKKPKRQPARVARGFWKDPHNQREFLDRIARDLNITHPEGWYHVTSKDVLSRGGRGLLRYHGDSLIRTLQSVYPDHEWRITAFSKVPRGYWKDLDNQRLLFDRIGRDLGLETLDDWYNVSYQDVIAHGGQVMLQYYNNSLIRALQAIYPEHPWRDSTRVARDHWKDEKNHRRFFDRVGEELGIKELDDWYNVKLEDVLARGGRGLLNTYYGNSLKRALRAVYPEHPWQDIKFARVPNAFWQDPSNHRLFFDALAVELGIQRFEDWYHVSLRDIIAKGGASLVKHYYNGSVVRALTSVYPEHPWDIPSFNNVPINHWKDVSNRRQFFDNIARELGIERPEQWYRVTVQDIHNKGGGALLIKYYGNSLVRALQSLYPEHHWQRWHFARISSDSGDDLVLLKEYIETLAKQLDVRHLDDWYRISFHQLRQSGGYRYIHRNGGLFLVLTRLYPEHHWDEKRFIAAAAFKKSSQRLLLVTLQKMFPDTEVLEEYQHPDLHFSNSSQKMELDIYIPSLSLAFEYHGEQHYDDSFGVMRSLSKLQQQQDEQKQEACKRAGITLVVVPYWWDGTRDSIATSIVAIRPDLSAVVNKQ